MNLDKLLLFLALVSAAFYRPELFRGVFLNYFHAADYLAHLLNSSNRLISLNFHRYPVSALFIWMSSLDVILKISYCF